jgi:hypothetical protein
MDGMSTGHFMGGITAAKQIFLTHRTVGHVFTSLTVVIIKKECINTHSTIITVPEILSSTNTTKATISTMIRTFVI